MKYFIASSPLLSKYALHQNVACSMLDYHGKTVKVEEDTRILDVIDSLPFYGKNLPEFNSKTIGQEAYENIILQATSQLKDSAAEKVVLSRTAFVPMDTTEEARKELLVRWRHKFPNALVFAVETDDGSQWVGATPEVLIQGRGERYFIDALAGTISYTGSETVQSFGEKEREEQAFVRSYIEEILTSLRLPYSVGPLSVRPYGAICHLYNQIEVTLSDKEKLAELERRIHPTSAVVGQPLNSAKEMISRLETHDRELYTGLLRFRMQDAYVSYVALRCAKVFSNGLLFYVGGGITRESSPESEWVETVLKLKSLIAT